MRDERIWKEDLSKIPGNGPLERFGTDTEEEIDVVRRACAELGDILRMPGLPAVPQAMRMGGQRLKKRRKPD